MDPALLDTDDFSEVLKAKNQNVVQRATAYRKQFGRHKTSAITVAKMVKGFQKRGRQNPIQAFARLGGRLPCG